MYQFNEWTRIHDDKCQYEYRLNNSKRPLRYIENTPVKSESAQDQYQFDGQYTQMTHIPPNEINLNTDLRPQTTNLNHIQLLQVKPFSINPYEGSGPLLKTNNLMNINTNMRGDSSRLIPYNQGEKVFVSNHIPEFLSIDPQSGAVIPDTWTVGGRSTRQDMRELYKEMCPR